MVKENKYLPDWMVQPQNYEPSGDRDGFLDKSYEAILNTLARMKYSPGKDGRYAASPSVKILYTFVLILLTACSKNYMYTLCIAAGTLTALALQPAERMKGILRTSAGAVLLSFLILLPSLFTGNSSSPVNICTKVMISVTLAGILSAGTSWNRLTAGLRSYHIPDVFIFTLDLTLKYITVLAEICEEVIVSCRLRSVGHNRKKEKAAAGILGITYLKSREMADDTYAAMYCRGFTGEYESVNRNSFKKIDLAYLLMTGAAVLLYFYMH